MNFLHSIPDRWRCWWRPLPCRECAALVDAVRQVVEVLDLYSARNRHLMFERDRAVRDLHDVLGLRACNDVQRLLDERND